MKSTHAVAGAAIVLLIAAIVVFWGSVGAPIRADEAAYALLADRLLRGGGWLYLDHWVPGFFYFDKPPLYFWLSAATESLLGFHPFSFRLWSGLFGCGAVLCTIVVGRNLQDLATGLIAGLVLAVNSSFLFVLGARDGVLNSAIVFFVAVALAVTTGGWPRRRPGLGALCLALAGAAAGWIKPLNGFIVLAVAAGAAACYASDERRPRLKMIALGAIPVAAANLLWPVLQWAHFGEAFIARFVDWNLLERFRSGINPAEVRPWYFYPAVIEPAMAVGWLTAGWRFLRERRTADRILCLVPLVYLAAISLTPSKLDSYAYPVYPLLAIAVAALVWRVVTWLAPSRRIATLGAVVIALGSFGLYEVRRDVALHPPRAWERPGCPASAEPGGQVEVLLVGVSTLDRIEAEARNTPLVFDLQRLGDRARLTDAQTAREIVRRQGPALIFVRRTGSGDLETLGLADRQPVASYPGRRGAPVETQLFAVGLDPTCG